MADPLTDAIGAEFQNPIKKISTGAGDPYAETEKNLLYTQGGDSGIPSSVTGAASAISGGEQTGGIPTPTAAPSSVTSGATALSGGTLPTSPAGAGTNTGPMAPAGTTSTPAPIDPNVAMNTVNTTFQSALGRAMTPQEQQQLVAALGYTPGAPIDQAMMDKASQLISQYAASQGGAAPAPGAPAPTSPGAPQPGTTPPPPVDPATGAIDPTTAMGTAQTAFKTKFGREMTAAEQQQLVAALNLQPGQPITQAQVDQALQLINGYTPGAQPGTQPGTQPGAQPGATPGGIDPNKAMADISAQFLQKFGRAPTPQEQQWLTQMSGYTTGMVTPEQMAAAVSAMGRYTGNINQPIKAEKPQTPEEIAANAKLRELLGEEWGEVDETSKGFAGQKQANQLAQQRSTERKRAALAERAAQRGGLQAGGFDVEQERLLQQQGEGEQAFESKLYADELQGQRDRLMKGIEMAKSMGLQEDAMALQEQLGTLDLKLREYLGKGQLGLGLMQNQLGQDKLGFDYAQLINLMNTQAINGMFGGG